MIHAEKGEPAGQVGVFIFGPNLQPHTGGESLWVSCADDIEAAKAAVREYAFADENRRAAVFPDCLTAAVFTRMTADGRLIGVGQPLDLVALGIIPQP